MNLKIKEEQRNLLQVLGNKEKTKKKQ